MLRIISSFLFLFLFLLSFQAQALVNMKNASFSNRWIDIIVPGKGYDLKIERFYSSRSLFIGMFGFGWCSELETNLSITSVGEIVLTECGGGLEVAYYPEKFDPVSVNSTIDLIIKTKKLQEPGISSSRLKQLRFRLTKDSYERFELAKRYGIISVKALKTRKNTFIAKNSKVDRIAFDGKVYTRQKKNGRIQRFNNKGQLAQIVDRAGNNIKIKYKGSKIQHIVDNQGRQLVFKYSQANGSLQKISNGQGLYMTYRFENENLVEVNNAWRNTYTFKYDQRHNLIQVNFPGGTNIRMTYDNINDWVTSYTDRRGCREKYAYTMSKDDSRNHYWSTVKKKCKGQTISGKYEFWFKRHTAGQGKFLDRVKTIVDGSLTDAQMHPIYGTPISIEKNNSKERRSYYGNGLIKQKDFKAFGKRKNVTEWYSLFYKYDSRLRKVNQTLKTFFGKKGEKIKSEKTEFKYNKKGLLTEAIKDGGKRILVNYDNIGRIQKLVDSKKTRLELKYNPNLDKPEIIKQPKVGEVVVEYDPTGEIVSVTSKKGRANATTIVKTFINFIDIIGPAAEELVI